MKDSVPNPGAQLLKAETLFNICQFEQAFIHFKKGHRIWPEDPRFSAGMADCSRVIINTSKKEIYSFEELPDFVEDVTKHIDAGNSLDEYKGIAVRNLLKTIS